MKFTESKVNDINSTYANMHREAGHRFNSHAVELQNSFAVAAKLYGSAVVGQQAFEGKTDRADVFFF